MSAGTAEFRTGALEDVDPARLGSFDKVLAVNVNLFWVRPAQAELGLVAELLRPHGRLHLVYEPPGIDRLTELEQRLVANLGRAGYTSETVTSAGVLSVSARFS